MRRLLPTLSIGTRVMVAITISSFIMGGAILVMTSRMVLTEVVERGIMRRDASFAPSQAACEANPQDWSLQVGAGMTAYAYSNDGVPTHPDAPRFRPDLAQRATHAANHLTVELALPPEDGGLVVMRAADSGPCAIHQLAFQSPPGMRRVVGQRLARVALIIVAFSLFFTWLIALRPLFGRLRQLSTAADTLGTDRFALQPRPDADGISRIERALAQAHKRQLQDAALQAQRQTNLQQHLANTAHDVRTPLASLQLTLERIVEASERSDQRSRGLLALEDVFYLVALTENLRLSAQLAETPSPVSRSVDLTRIVERVGGRFRILGRNKGVSVRVGYPDNPVRVVCDAAMAEQVISNFVHNAVSHHPGDGSVTILLSVPSDTTFQLDVLDDGDGVPPHTIPQLTERSFRASGARTRDPAGSGLGLAIAAEICSRCGWTLTFAPREPSGLAVTVAGTLD